MRLPFALALTLAIAEPASGRVIVEPMVAVPSGIEPGIAVSGLAPGQGVRIHAFAIFGRWVDGGNAEYKEVVETYHSWADVRADRRGRIAMDRAQVAGGTYRGVDGYGLL